jgi:mannose-6-phosphate isomerase-like protein (cupin superfamily)
MIRKSPADCACYRIKASDTNYFVLLADPLTDGVDFITVVEIFEPGGATPPNAHVAAWEQFVVLAGSGVAHCDGRATPVERGDILIVPPGMEHVVHNVGPGKLYCLTTMIPNEGFAELIHAGIPVELDAADVRVLADHLGVGA